MPVDQWHIGVLTAAILVNTLLVGAAYYASRKMADATAREAQAAAGGQEHVDRDDGIVTCPDCGTENEYGYRFCRSCVGELPKAMSFGEAGDGPLERVA